MGGEVLPRKRMARALRTGRSLLPGSIHQGMLTKLLRKRMMLSREARRVEEEVGSEAVQQDGSKTPE